MSHPCPMPHAPCPDRATAFSPASVGNVGVGFDLLGHALEGIGDTVTATRIDEPVVRVASITGYITSLPREAERNTAGRAVAAWRESRRVAFGVELAIEKGIALGSGMGGSAASAVAAVVAAQALLGDVDLESLYPFALAGETVASGSAHGDNVGPQLLGGLVFATHDRLVRIPVPEALTCVVVHPDQVLETRVARAALAARAAAGEPQPALADVRAGLHDPARVDLRGPVRAGREAALLDGCAQLLVHLQPLVGRRYCAVVVLQCSKHDARFDRTHGALSADSGPPLESRLALGAGDRDECPGKAARQP